MSSLNQLISEIAHSVQQADSVPVRRAIRQAIIHARNELIRHSYSNHNYTDKVLKQKYNLEIIKSYSNPKLAIPGEYKHSYESTSITNTYPKVNIDIEENNLIISGSLFGGAIGFENEVTLYNIKDNIYKLEASFDNPKYHAEIGPIINDVYFSLTFDEYGYIHLKAFQNYESNNYIILTSGGQYFVDYKLLQTKHSIAFNIVKTVNKVHKPVRFTNNLPFHSVIAHSEDNELVIPFVSEGAAKYYKHLPGMCKGISYDYINGKIHAYNLPDNIDTITVESVFEYPHEVAEDYTNDNDEFFLPEDLVNAVKKLTLETFNVQVVRDTNEIPNPNLLK